MKNHILCSHIVAVISSLFLSCSGDVTETCIQYTGVMHPVQINAHFESPSGEIFDETLVLNSADSQELTETSSEECKSIPQGYTYKITIKENDSDLTCTFSPNSEGTANYVNGQDIVIQLNCGNENVALFYSDLVDGDFAGSRDARTEADELCVETVQGTAFGNTCTGSIRALISISTSDEIRDMEQNFSLPADKPFVDHNNDTVIAENLDDLLDGSIDNPLSDPGSLFWWSGSSSSGEVEGTCNTWTSTSQPSASIGLTGVTNETWMGTDGDCVTPKPLLCVCF